MPGPDREVLEFVLCLSGENVIVIARFECIGAACEKQKF